ncbi:MAG: glycoside hydrolase family 3 N-terminal domain-containing protein, partial [Spirochaetales bacterium]|nr:glycoside hydrolase family 3 N-terminal domain-containing protein [Spirochaetales bacterium]
MKGYFVFISFLIILLTSCRSTAEKPGDLKDTDRRQIPSENTALTPEPVLTLEQYRTDDTEFTSLSPAGQNKLIRSVINQMSMDEKIGQIFMLAVRHSAWGQPALEADDYIKEFMDRYKPGGIIFFSLNFESPGQTRQMIQDLQDHSAYPLFITTDEEGGKVSRLGKAENMNVISLPPAAELGTINSPELTEYAASVLAADMRDLGFNMNMAPVADLRAPLGQTDIMRTRSFSRDPAVNADMTAAFVKGLQDKGISSVLKHFPGHGNVDEDSHHGASASDSSRTEFREREFASFRSGIEAGAHFVLTAHIAAPALSG